MEAVNSCENGLFYGGSQDCAKLNWSEYYLRMESNKSLLWKVGLVVLALIEGSYSTLSPSGINYEGLVLSLCFSFDLIYLLLRLIVVELVKNPFSLLLYLELEILWPQIYIYIQFFFLFFGWYISLILKIEFFFFSFTQL